MKKPQTNRLSVAFQVTKWVWNTIFHQTLAVVTVFAIWHACINYTSTMSWHVILSTLGYIPLMAEGIILFANDNVWTQDLDRKTKYWLHGGLLFLATLFLTAGTGVAIYSKGDRPNFTSIHGRTGIASMVAVIVSIFIGLIAANTTLFKRIARPVWFKFIHNFLGTAGYVVGIVSLIYGYYTNMFIRTSTETSRLAASIATGLVTAWSLHMAIVSCFHQVKSIFSR